MIGFKSLRLRQALLAGAATAASMSMLAAPAAYAQEATRTYAIQAQDLGSALRQFGLQTGRDVLFPPSVVAGKRSAGVQGTFTEQGALNALLRGSGLLAERTRSGGYAVRVAAPGMAGNEDATQLEEVVVTGTRIAGQAPVGAPVVTLDRDDFDRAGAATVQDVLNTIPQAFGGAPGDTTSYVIGNQSNIASDQSAGSYVDLRGLGPGTTLTLVNGRRMARGGQQEVMDVSMIPLAAIERTEILFDGASALYGSDAIGGVINFITRKDYEGMELRLRTGLSSRGDAPEHQVALTAGRAGDRGSLLGGYSFNSSESYSSADRPFAQGQKVTDIDVDQRVHNLFLSGRYQLTPRLEVDGIVNYADRYSDSVVASTTDPEPSLSRTDVQAYGLSGGVTFELSSDWDLKANVTYGENRADADAESTFSGTLVTTEYRYVSDLLTAEALLTGPLLQLPAGPLDAAFGVSVREENYDDQINAYSDRDRSTAAFAEFRVPLLGNGEAYPRAALSVAARYEDYETWGETFDPRFGLSLDPIPGLRLRGSYGTSFRAPTAPERTPFNALNFAFVLSDPQASAGSSRALILTGNNPELQPESAVTWTAGVDYSPASLPSLRLSATWYDIDYTDRIDRPAINVISALSDPNSAYAVARRSGASDPAFDAMIVQRLSEFPLLFGCGPFIGPGGFCQRPAADFGAIVDTRLSNLASLRTSGLDLTAGYSLVQDDATWDFSVSAAWVKEYIIQNSPSTADQNLLDSPYRPLDLRLIGQASYARGPWRVSAIANYADDYQNNTVSPLPGVIIPPTPIEAFTTVSLNVQREFGPSMVFDSGARIIFNIDNLFDEDPPTFENNFLIGLGANEELINYDPANASARGRYFSVTLVANW